MRWCIRSRATLIQTSGRVCHGNGQESQVPYRSEQWFALPVSWWPTELRVRYRAKRWSTSYFHLATFECAHICPRLTFAVLIFSCVSTSASPLNGHFSTLHFSTSHFSITPFCTHPSSLIFLLPAILFRIFLPLSSLNLLHPLHILIIVPQSGQRKRPMSK